MAMAAGMNQLTVESGSLDRALVETSVRRGAGCRAGDVLLNQLRHDLSQQHTHGKCQCGRSTPDGQRLDTGAIPRFVDES